MKAGACSPRCNLIVHVRFSPSTAQRHLSGVRKVLRIIACGLDTVVRLMGEGRILSEFSGHHGPRTGSCYGEWMDSWCIRAPITSTCSACNIPEGFEGQTRGVHQLHGQTEGVFDDQACLIGRWANLHGASFLLELLYQIGL